MRHVNEQKWSVRVHEISTFAGFVATFDLVFVEEQVWHLH